jgi:two-component system KDP operon response regulator KdpE
MARVLVVDDEPQIRRAVRRALEAHGLLVDVAETGEQALDLAAAQAPDVVVLDLGLPGVRGDDVLRDLRKWSDAPVIVLTVEDADRTKIEALELGADDYVTKPFSMDELMARVRVQLRRAAGLAAGEPVLEAGRVRIDLARRIVTVEGSEIHLTPIEYELLAFLVRNAGRVVTHRMILANVWGPEYVDASHYVRIHVSHLRRKLEADPDRPRLIRTEPGVGYRFDADARSGQSL